MAEFFNDEQRAAHLAALEREKAGYEARMPRAKYKRDPLASQELEDRIDQVEAEIARVRSLDSQEEPLAEAKPKRSRGGKKEKAAAAPAGGGDNESAGESAGGKE